MFLPPSTISSFSMSSNHTTRVQSLIPPFFIQDSRVASGVEILVKGRKTSRKGKKIKRREETRELRRDTSSASSLLFLPLLFLLHLPFLLCLVVRAFSLSYPYSLAFRIDDSCLQVSLISLLWCPFCAEDGLPWNFFSFSPC